MFQQPAFKPLKEANPGPLRYNKHETLPQKLVMLVFLEVVAGVACNIVL
jgi:hypothetical protein